MALTSSRFTAAALLFSLLLPLGLPAGGCFSFVTKEEGDEMKKNIKSLTDQVAAQNDDLGKYKARLEVLEKDNDRRRTVLADAGDLLKQLKDDMEMVKGRLDETQKTFDTQQKSIDLVQKNFSDYRAQSDTKIEQLTNASTTAKNPPLPETPDALFAEAQKRIDAKQWNEARRMFDAFINRNPADKRAAQAQLLIGDAYFNEGKYANAIGAYTKVVDNFPKSEEVESAMFKNGQSFYALKYCGDARIYFQELLRRYPRTKFKADSMEQIKELTRKAKDKAACTQ